MHISQETSFLIRIKKCLSILRRHIYVLDFQRVVKRLQVKQKFLCLTCKSRITELYCLNLNHPDLFVISPPLLSSRPLYCHLDPFIVISTPLLSSRPTWRDLMRFLDSARNDKGRVISTRFLDYARNDKRMSSRPTWRDLDNLFIALQTPASCHLSRPVPHTSC